MVFGAGFSAGCWASIEVAIKRESRAREHLSNGRLLNMVRRFEARVYRARAGSGLKIQMKKLAVASTIHKRINPATWAPPRCHPSDSECRNAVRRGERDPESCCLSMLCQGVFLRIFS